MTLEQLTEFLGWCTLMNVVILAVSALCVVAFRSSLAQLHANLFGMEQATLPGAYFRYLGYYKIGILLLNLTPYLALRLFM